MSEVAIRVEGVGKKYRIGAKREGYKTLRDALASAASAPARVVRGLAGRNGHGGSDSRGEFWALRDISFELARGEVLGVIGANGAGKSTLLKILSRITHPTTGDIEIHGRVGSLLEVGTGFHPELTGRENIYLNGAILGMPRAEVRRKFDEIVDFAGVEQFLDTPVKRYSSGMYVRLAFAVAAHLEPEILVVDEVLAVGDAEFQKKCLGKMNSVATKDGRTVLFVSHNMEAVMRLCNSALLLEKGNVKAYGHVGQIVTEYLKTGSSASEIVDLKSSVRPMPVRGQVRLLAASVISSNPQSPWKVPYGEGIVFDVEVEALGEVKESDLAVALLSSKGFEVASCLSSHSLPKLSLDPGKYKYRVEYKNLRLTPGLYRFGLGIRSNLGFEDYVAEAFELEIVPTEHSSSKEIDMFRGAIVPDVDFSFTKAAG